MTRADVVFADGRRIPRRHVIRRDGAVAATSFGTFTWSDNAWRWVADRTTTLELPPP